MDNFNLSEKRSPEFMKGVYLYAELDVKEFIRLLKKRIHNIYGETFEEMFYEEILNPLLGDELK